MNPMLLRICFLIFSGAPLMRLPVYFHIAVQRVHQAVQMFQNDTFPGSGTSY